jgi:hypothetical protein
VITFTHTGDFRNTERFLKRMSKMDFANVLRGAAQRGVQALSAATPANSGLASSSWGYETKRSRNSFQIIWTNSDIENGFPVVIGLQYGHGTRNGGYVQGRDFINPAMRPIFEQILSDIWTEVTTA